MSSGGGHRNFNYIWVLAGGYLVYLGVSLLLQFFRGAASGGALSLASGVGFTAVGGALLLREWRLYRDGAANDAQDEPPEEDSGKDGEA